MTEHNDDPFVESEDVKASEDQHKIRGENFGEDLRRIATDSAYAAAGFAGLVGEKAKEFFDEQRRQYSKAHPGKDEEDPETKAFLAQLKEKVNAFVDELSKVYRDMVDRGRDAHSKSEKAEDTVGDEKVTGEPMAGDSSDDPEMGEAFGDEVVIDDTILEDKPQGETFVDSTTGEVADDERADL